MGGPKNFVLRLLLIVAVLAAWEGMMNWIAGVAAVE